MSAFLSRSRPFPSSRFLPLLLLLAPHVAHAQAWGQDPSSGTPFPRETTSSPTSPSPDDEEPPAAPEPAAPRFGAPGQLVATFAAGGANGAGISYEHFNNSQATALSASIAVGLDYFVVKNISIGFDLQGGYSDDKGYGADSSLVATKTSSFSGGVRLGLNVPLGERFSLYPRLTLGVEGAHQAQTVVAGSTDSVGDSVGAPATTKVGPWMNAFVPLLFHVTPHFFLGLGPRFEHTFANASGAPSGTSAQSTLVEGAFVLGGVFGGESPPVDSPPAEAGARLSRFGDRGTFVLTSETDGYASTTSYAGTGASASGIYVRPGFDVFAVDHFSLGLDISFGYTRDVSVATNGAQVLYTGKSFGVAPRFGVEVPVTSWLSWYPRAEIGFGSASQNESSAGASNDHTYTQTWVSAEAPLIVHVARHFFAGLGPWASHDIENTDQNNYANLGTTIGISSLLGGWL